MVPSPDSPVPANPLQVAPLLPVVVQAQPGTRDDTGPAGGVQAWFLYPLHDPTTTLVPLAVLQPVSDRHMPVAGLSRVTGVAPSVEWMLRG
jgi:hypothetical protein